jgi:hypothetical protein
MLRQGGRLAFLIRHPAFRVPRQSGWGWDPKRKLRYRRIDSYLSYLAVPLRPRSGRPAFTSYHRPLADYLNAVARAGLHLQQTVEVRAPRTGEGDRGEFPLYLAVLATKTG